MKKPNINIPQQKIAEFCQRHHIRRRLNNYLTACLEAGMATDEFHTVPVRATPNLIVALLNGLMRQRGLKFEEVEGIKETAVDFCRRSLVNTEFGHG